MPIYRSRREFLRELGVSAAAMPFLMNLPSMAFANQAGRKQRLVVMFSPNGVIPEAFWPDEEGENFTLKESMTPLRDFRDKTLFLHGVCDKVRGDGDNHMRGIGCLLTGVELYPGNIQGGSDTPAGWSMGHSIDQEIKRYLQNKPETRTRFGSLEFGVLVPNRADTWTRMVYAGPNQPIAPINDPYQMFNKLYGRRQDEESLRSILDDLKEDLDKVKSKVSKTDARLIDEHATLVREMEQELRGAQAAETHAQPALDPDVKNEAANMPRLAKMHIELLVNSFAADFSRIATLQFTNSVGDVRMSWLDVSEGHHELSHHDDKNEDSRQKLIKINKWYCEQLAYLAKRLAETPEPGGEGSLLDNTTIIWTNELGKGNSHTLDNTPFVLVGGGLGFKMGRSHKLKGVPHNRLLLSLAQSFGHDLKKFGNHDFCGDGALTGLT